MACQHRLCSAICLSREIASTTIQNKSNQGSFQKIDENISTEFRHSKLRFWCIYQKYNIKKERHLLEICRTCFKQATSKYLRAICRKISVIKVKWSFAEKCFIRMTLKITVDRRKQFVDSGLFAPSPCL